MSEIVSFLSDPNIAYLLLTLGLLAILGEVVHPGTVFLGLVGAVLLILGFVGLGNLPFTWGGVLLLGLAAGLFTFELLASGSGLLALAALIAFVAGSLVLYAPAPGAPGVAVSPWLIGMMAALMTVFFLYVVRVVRASRKVPIAAGPEALRHAKAYAVSRLNPRGSVRINGEIWTAITEGESVEAGQSVEVTGVEGVVLKVRGITSDEQSNWANTGWEQNHVNN
jgi:membrane-bound serine protease (ClpP class)